MNSVLKSRPRCFSPNGKMLRGAHSSGLCLGPPGGGASDVYFSCMTDGIGRFGAGCTQTSTIRITGGGFGGREKFVPVFRVGEFFTCCCHCGLDVVSCSRARLMLDLHHVTPPPIRNPKPWPHHTPIRKDPRASVRVCCWRRALALGSCPSGVVQPGT